MKKKLCLMIVRVAFLGIIVADFSRWGIFEGYGFVKRGDMVTVGASNITTINLADPNKEALLARSNPSGEQHRDLSALNSADGKIVTGLDFRRGELIEKFISSLARFFLSYPEHPVYPNLREKTKAMLYASNVLRVRPDGETFVCADMYSGVIDFLSG